MNDLEIAKKCAEAMGAKEDVCNGEHHWHFPDGNYILFSHWNPLKEDAQAMALVKRLKIDVEHNPDGTCIAEARIENSMRVVSWVDDNLNRAICGCAAEMGTERE